MRRVLRGSEKRLKKLSWGSKLQAALTSSTYLGLREEMALGLREGLGSNSLPPFSIQALPSRKSPWITWAMTSLPSISIWMLTILWVRVGCPRN